MLFVGLAARDWRRNLIEARVKPPGHGAAANPSLCRNCIIEASVRALMPIELQDGPASLDSDARHSRLTIPIRKFEDESEEVTPA